MDPVIAGKTDKRLALEIRELEAKIRDLTVPPILMDFAERCDDVAERLEDMTLAGKREIMRAVMERKGYVKLHRSPHGRQPGSVPAVDRVHKAGDLRLHVISKVPVRRGSRYGASFSRVNGGCSFSAS
jgi:hypothetical protein